MELNSTQKKAIGDYIFGITRYIETYNEIYDHVLNAIDQEDGIFGMEAVIQIINRDFGGKAGVRQQEESFQKQLKLSHLRLIGLQMIDSFRPSQLLPNLIVMLLCFILYTANLQLISLFKTVYFSILSLLVFAGIVWIVYRYVLNRQTMKDSLKGELIFGLIFLPISLINIFANALPSRTLSINVSVDGKNLLALVIFFFLAIYLQSFFRLYKEKLKLFVNN
jgi:hypothetical protein